MIGKRDALYAASLSAIALIISASIARAEPGPRVQLLIDKPASMFSFGMYRLDQSFGEQFGYGGAHASFESPLYGELSYGTAVNYDWSGNRITLWLLRFVATPAGWDSDEECRQAIREVRRRGLIDPTTGSPQEGTPSSYWGQMFQPIGYGSKDLEGVAEAMDGIIQIKVQTPELLCSASLLGTGYAVEKR